MALLMVDDYCCFLSRVADSLSVAYNVLRWLKLGYVRLSHDVESRYTNTTINHFLNN